MVEITKAFTPLIWSGCEMSNPVPAPVQAFQLASVVNHVRNNNVAYLLGVLIAHMIGLLEKVWGNGSGMF